MARIDLPDGAGLEVGKALMLAPHFVDVVVGYEKAIAASPLDPRLHELVRYRIALLNQCTVCLDFRRDGSGVTDEELARVGDPEGFTGVEHDALRFTEMFCRDSAAIPDDLLASLEAALGTAGLVDLTLVVGKYVAMGRFMQVLGLDQACSIDHARLAQL
jgi:alkylhydroperoxidase family enzyme